MPSLTRPDGVEIHWEERGQGPTVVFGVHFLNYPAVFERLISDLAGDHRVVTWDPRGTGASTRSGPYDIDTDVADLAAVAEAVGAPVTLLELFAPRAILLADTLPELVGSVVIMGTAPPLGSEELEGFEGFSGSRQVIDGLARLLEADPKAGFRAILTNTNPEFDDDQLRERIDETTRMIDGDAAAGRLHVLREVRVLAPQAAALGDRLHVVCFETEWYGTAMMDRARELLPEADIVEAEDGPISRPDLTAEVARRATAGLR